MTPHGGLMTPERKKHDDVCWVLGIIDSYGAVDSKTMLLSDRNVSDTHETYWPNTLKRWRWSPGDGFIDVAGREPDEFDTEEMDMIVRHLEGLGFRV